VRYIDSDTQYLFQHPEEWTKHEYRIQYWMATHCVCNRVLALRQIIDRIFTYHGGTLDAMYLSQHMRRLTDGQHPANALRMAGGDYV
jgi:hypothetical protein